MMKSVRAGLGMVETEILYLLKFGYLWEVHIKLPSRNGYSDLDFEKSYLKISVSDITLHLIMGAKEINQREGTWDRGWE